MTSSNRLVPMQTAATRSAYAREWLWSCTVPQASHVTVVAAAVVVELSSLTVDLGC